MSRQGEEPLSTIIGRMIKETLRESNRKSLSKLLHPWRNLKLLFSIYVIQIRKTELLRKRCDHPCSTMKNLSFNQTKLRLLLLWFLSKILDSKKHRKTRSLKLSSITDRLLNSLMRLFKTIVWSSSSKTLINRQSSSPLQFFQATSKINIGEMTRITWKQNSENNLKQRKCQQWFL